MKTSVLTTAWVVCILIFASSIVDAQPTIKAGLTYAKVSIPNQNLLSVKSKPNLFLGISNEIGLGNRFYIEPGISYYRLTNEYRNSIVNFTASRDYIAIPLLLNYHIIKEFHIGGGFQSGILINDGFRNDFDNKDFELSSQVHVTLYPVYNIGIELGYNYGLTPYIKFDDVSVGDVQFERGNGNNRFLYTTLLFKF